MSDVAAMKELLDWVAERPRSYAETIDAWRSSCPRLTVWEDAIVEGLVEVRGGRVRLARRGHAARAGGAPASAADGRG